MQKLPRIHAKEKVLSDETPFGIFAIKHNIRPTQNNCAVALLQNLINIDTGNRINKNNFTPLTNSIQIPLLKSSMRSFIKKYKCKGRARRLFFAILIIANQLVKLMHKKNVSIDPSDFMLIFKFVKALRPSKYEMHTFELMMSKNCIANKMERATLSSAINEAAETKNAETSPRPRVIEVSQIVDNLYINPNIYNNYYALHFREQTNLERNLDI
uniref:FUZ/MON1/HPS1 second Longin domain-containing protein n=1 Tax=Glossina palpalis gambiensis TaxID=67801 RepID=A0A1B0BGD2_9MUSC